MYIINHTGISVGNTVHLEYRILNVRKRSKLSRYNTKIYVSCAQSCNRLSGMCANVTITNSGL